MSRETARRGQHEADRAEILRLLVPGFPEPLTFNGLREGLLIGGRPMEDEGLNFQIAYLEQGGYVIVNRAERRGRKKILSVAATKKGIDLVDGRIPEDPGIAL